jgi:hypothetical protein
MEETMAPPEDAPAIAERAAESIRALNHATQPATGRLSYPAEVYEILGSLEAMAQRLPQACGQLAEWLDHQAEGGRLKATDGPFADDVPAAVATATHWLNRAARLAEELRLALANSQVAVGGLAHVGSDDGEEQ